MLVRSLLVAGAAYFSSLAAAGQQQPIAYVPTDGVTVSGSLEVVNGKATIGNDGSITAGDKTANVTLARGGEVRLCASTTVRLTRDRSITPDSGKDSTALMLSLDRGALEATYKTGSYSDVLLTPDLRILVSGPGDADLKMRVNQKGDTCIDNHGDNAPYITVTSQFEGGVYRVKPNQRVLFEHARPGGVVMTTPNREYNVKFETLPAGKFRHQDHRFEWSRSEFQEWANRVATAHRYEVAFLPVGTEDALLGAPTQMAIFRRKN